MIFRGRIIQIGDNPIIEQSTVILEMPNGSQFEFPVSRKMAQALGKRLYTHVAIELVDPVLIDVVSIKERLDKGEMVDKLERVSIDPS